MPGSALEPVSLAVFAKLQGDETLQGLTPGGWHDDLPQAPTYPCGWFEVRERDIRGFGTGGLPEVELRTHVLTAYAGKVEAMRINSRVVQVLKDAALVVEGYDQCGLIFWDDSAPIADEEINGVKVKEIVGFYRIYVEEQ